MADKFNSKKNGVFRVSMCGDDGDEVEQMSRDGSQYSLTTGILPSLGATSTNRRIKLRNFIVSPYDRRYRQLSIHIYIHAACLCI